MAPRKGPNKMAASKNLLATLGNQAGFDLNEPMDEQGNMMGQVYDPYPVPVLAQGPPPATFLFLGPRPVPVLAQGPPPVPVLSLGLSLGPTPAPVLSQGPPPPLPVELGKGAIINPRPSPSRTPLPSPGQPQTVPFINGVHEQVYKVTVEKEELKLELIRFRNMLNSARMRADQLAKENEGLKKKFQEVSAFFR